MAQTLEGEIPHRKIGEYEITARIGVGGMGVVYEGKQPLIGKRVAVKVLLPSFSREKELVERFIAEARAVNEIRHRGIVDIFGMGQLPDGSHYLVMEYLEGEPFDRLIKRRGGEMPIGEVLGLMEEILDALDAAHAAGIIHRDIKPSNLFLVNGGRGRSYVKLLDFGIAKLGVSNNSDTPQTRASVIMGTPDYISPEQARGRPISARTDIYALGVVLFEMLTGERPFQGENTLATMWMHVEDAAPSASDLRPDIPPQLDELILWAMEKDPAKRPQSAEDMRAHIESIRASLLPGTASMTPSPLTGREILSPGGSTPSGLRRPGTPSPVRVRTPMPKPDANPGVGPPRKSNQAAVPVLPDGGRPQSAQETRLAPLPAFDEEARTNLVRPQADLQADLQAKITTAPERDAVSRQRTSGDVENELFDDVLPKRGNGGLIAAVVVLVVLAVVAVVLVVQELRAPGKDPSPPTPIEPVQVAPVRPAVEVVPVAPKPPVVDRPPAVTVKPVGKGPVEGPPDQPPKPNITVDKPVDKPVATTVPRVKPPVEKPVPKGISAQQLESRLAKLEAKLAARDAQSGEPDKVLRTFIGQAKKQVASAQSESDRRDASKFLDDVAEQLGQ